MILRAANNRLWSLLDPGWWAEDCVLDPFSCLGDMSNAGRVEVGIILLPSVGKIIDDICNIDRT